MLGVNLFKSKEFTFLQAGGCDDLDKFDLLEVKISDTHPQK